MSGPALDRAAKVTIGDLGCRACGPRPWPGRSTRAIPLPCGDDGGPSARRGAAGRRRRRAAGADRPACRLRLLRPGRGQRLPPRCRRRPRRSPARRRDRAVAPRGVPRHRRAARASAFRTPLGDVPVDRAAIAAIPGRRCSPTSRTGASTRSRSSCRSCSARWAHGFALVPLVVGDAADEEVAAVLEPFADDPATLVVVSSDLSHFLGYEAAVRRDRATAEAIERLDGAAIGAVRRLRLPADPRLAGARAAARTGGRAARPQEQRRHGRATGAASSATERGPFRQATPAPGTP